MVMTSTPLLAASLCLIGSSESEPTRAYTSYELTYGTRRLNTGYKTVPATVQEREVPTWPFSLKSGPMLYRIVYDIREYSLKPLPMSRCPGKSQMRCISLRHTGPPHHSCHMEVLPADSSAFVIREVRRAWRRGHLGSDCPLRKAWCLQLCGNACSPVDECDGCAIRSESPI